MSTRSDFSVIKFSEHLGEDSRDLNEPGAFFVGNSSTAKRFIIDNTPCGEAYLLIQVRGIQDLHHTIRLNDISIADRFDLPMSPEWQTCMIVIEPGTLRRGENTLQFLRNHRNTDNFVVGNVVVNWRETV